MQKKPQLMKIPYRTFAQLALFLTIISLYTACSLGLNSKKLHQNAGQNQLAAQELWKEMTAADLNEIYKILQENHPGPLDTENIFFKNWMTEGVVARIYRNTK